MSLWHISAVAGLMASGLIGPAAANACDLPRSETVRIATAIDGETLALEDGREVRLLGIKAPKPPPDWTGGEPWPFAARAKTALAQLAENKAADLHFDTRTQDRYGRLLAQVFLKRDGEQIWLQESLVTSGQARVFVLPDLRACIAPLLAAEEDARKARRGLWRSLSYRVRDAHKPRALWRLKHSYHLIEGTVEGIGEGRKLVYINFDEDWRHDFTAIIKRKRLPALEADGLDLQALKGKRVRVRGWVEWWNGPMVAVSNLEEIEILPSDAPAN